MIMCVIKFQISECSKWKVWIWGSDYCRFVLISVSLYYTIQVYRDSIIMIWNMYIPNRKSELN